MTLSTSRPLALYAPLQHQGAGHYGKMVNTCCLNAILVKPKADGASCPACFWVVGQALKAKVSTASRLLFNRIQ